MRWSRSSLMPDAEDVVENIIMNFRVTLVARMLNSGDQQSLARLHRRGLGVHSIIQYLDFHREATPFMLFGKPCYLSDPYD